MSRERKEMGGCGLKNIPIGEKAISFEQEDLGSNIQNSFK
jgi:hypothetical protein